MYGDYQVLKVVANISNYEKDKVFTLSRHLPQLYSKAVTQFSTSCGLEKEQLPAYLNSVYHEIFTVG